jgi:hypothetical protein
MQVRYRKELANHPDPESCGMRREARAEALTRGNDRPSIEARNNQSRTLGKILPNVLYARFAIRYGLRRRFQSFAEMRHLSGHRHVMRCTALEVSRFAA